MTSTRADRRAWRSCFRKENNYTAIGSAISGYGVVYTNPDSSTDFLSARVLFLLLRMLARAPSPTLFTRSGGGRGNGSSTENLIPNPLLIATGTPRFATDPPIVPVSWGTQEWGDAADASTTFEFPASNWTGPGNGAEVTVSNYPNTRQAVIIWVFDTVSSTPGAEYHFTDQYISDAPSLLEVGYLTNGSYGNWQIVSVPSSNGVLATTTITFTPPPGSVGLEIFHVLGGNGSLTTGNFSLIMTQSAQSNVFSQGIVSLTFDDGLQSQYDNALPILRCGHTWYVLYHHE